MSITKYLLIFLLCLAFLTSCSHEPEEYSIPITIINNTEANPVVLFIRRPDTAFWYAVARYSASSTEYPVAIPFQYMSIENRIDLMLQPSSSTSSEIYKKVSQTIKPGIVITFTNDDKGW